MGAPGPTATQNWTHEEPGGQRGQWRGERVNDLSQVLHRPKNKLYLEGSATIMTALIQDKFKRKAVKVAYFGDHYLSDIYAVWLFNRRLEQVIQAPARWDSIAVIEEMAAKDKSYWHR